MRVLLHSVKLPASLKIEVKRRVGPPLLNAERFDRETVRGPCVAVWDSDSALVACFNPYDKGAERSGLPEFPEGRLLALAGGLAFTLPVDHELYAWCVEQVRRQIAEGATLATEAEIARARKLEEIARKQREAAEQRLGEAAPPNASMPLCGLPCGPEGAESCVRTPNHLGDCRPRTGSTPPATSAPVPPAVLAPMADPPSASRPPPKPKRRASA